MEPLTRGDPESPLRWTCKSTRALAEELDARRAIRSAMRRSRSSCVRWATACQSNRKTEEGDDHPDRDAQFRHINEQVRAGAGPGSAGHLGGHQEEGTDRELRQRRPAMAAGEVSPAGQRARLPRSDGAASLSLRDLRPGAQHRIRERGNRSRHGRVRRGFDSRLVARRRPAAVSEGRTLLITADGGGSNGYRLRLWKLELQRLGRQTGLRSPVCHFPPGTSKWNKVEHRLFSFISSNWRGEPLRDYETIVQLIAGTTTAKGLKVTCRLDRRRYPTGRRVAKAENAAMRRSPHDSMASGTTSSAHGRLAVCECY